MGERSIHVESEYYADLTRPAEASSRSVAFESLNHVGVIASNLTSLLVTFL